MSRKPGNHLQVERVRGQLEDFLQRFEFEVAAESTPRHLHNVRAVCVLLCEKLVRLQGHETLETRAYEEKIETLTARGKALWEPAKPLAKGRPRLSLIPGGLS